jgi:tetratricopeptide (TPR) repeat protein
MGNRRRSKRASDQSEQVAITRLPPGDQAVESPAADSFTGRCVRLGLASVLIAGLIVGVLAWWNPPPDDPDQQMPFATPTIRLPRTAAEATAEELEKELIGISDLLQQRFGELPEALHVAATVYAELRQTRKAEEIWQRCISLAPSNLAPRVALATIAMERGEDQAAIEALSDALAEGHSSPELDHHLATAFSKVGRVEDAEQLLQGSLKKYEPVAENWRLLGQTQWQLEQLAEAETSLLRALELGDRSGELYLALTHVSSRLGKEPEAERYREAFRKRRAVLPEDADQPFQVTYAAAMRRNLVNTLGKAGAVFAHQGDMARAERLLLRAIALDPGHAEILRELARMLLEQQRVPDAWLVHRRLVELDPPNYLDCINLATVATELGDYESVERALRLAMDLRPQMALPYLGLARLYLDVGRLEEARWHANAAVRREPSLAAYAALAAACQELGDREAADAAREAAKQLAAQYPSIEDHPLVPTLDHP